VLYDRLIVGLTSASRLSGRAEPPHASTPVELGRLRLRLGPLEARSIFLDDDELVRRLFFAVRGTDWGTASNELVESGVSRNSAAFTLTTTAVSVDVRHKIDFAWTGNLTGTAGGSISFAVSGTARSAFDFGRIGLCVLHPPDFAGGRYRARTVDGWIEGELSHEISPQMPGPHGFGEPLFQAFHELVLLRADGFGSHLELEGDLFELEDQRNWTDASYKTYSTPLELGPGHADPGFQVSQSVRITPIDPPRRPRRRPAGSPTLELGDPLSFTVPPIGLCVAGNRDLLTQREAELLRVVDPAHLRADLYLGSDAFAEELAPIAAQAAAVGSRLELALTLAARTGAVDLMAAALHAGELPVARLLIFRAGSVVTPCGDAAAVRASLRGAGVTAPVFGGTDRLFADLNGDRPEMLDYEGIAYPLCPTVHADDDLSLVETMAMHGVTVETVRGFAGRLPIVVTPLTFRERPLPDWADDRRGEPEADVRQSSLLGAVWTLGTAASLARAGVNALTYFETVGPRGVIADTSGTSRPVFPLYHVLADLCEWRGSLIRSTSPSPSASVESLAVRDPDGITHFLIANPRPDPAEVIVRGLPPRLQRVRRLNESSFDAAGLDPHRFRTETERTRVETLELSGYEIVRVDVDS
jgi:D-apionolactonase